LARATTHHGERTRGGPSMGGGSLAPPDPPPSGRQK